MTTIWNTLSSVEILDHKEPLQNIFSLSLSVFLFLSPSFFIYFLIFLSIFRFSPSFSIRLFLLPLSISSPFPLPDSFLPILVSLTLFLFISVFCFLHISHLSVSFTLFSISLYPTFCLSFLSIYHFFQPNLVHILLATKLRTR